MLAVGGRARLARALPVFALVLLRRPAAAAGTTHGEKRSRRIHGTDSENYRVEKKKNLDALLLLRFCDLTALKWPKAKTRGVRLGLVEKRICYNAGEFGRIVCYKK